MIFLCECSEICTGSARPQQSELLIVAPIRKVGFSMDEDGLFEVGGSAD
jgi:hypothetical protein